MAHRHILGVQIPSQQVFGCLGYQYIKYLAEDSFDHFWGCWGSIYADDDFGWPSLLDL